MRGTVVVSSLSSDAHTWNLIFLQLLVEECGFDVVNLGPCVPDDLLVEECRTIRPALVVLSSVNGHGYRDGVRVVPRLRAALTDTPIVVGGKLGVAGEIREAQISALLQAGFDDVFADDSLSVSLFRQMIEAVPQAAGIAG
nr:cobalamin-dependent protein [Streptomyces sp. NBC_00830]WTB35752.1 cobalamin-dependent protein [Streptomyces sp. NBC_00830]